jgi:adenosine deaminase
MADQSIGSHTTNLLTGGSASFADHPFNAYRTRGLRIALMCNNPTLFNTTLTQEYQLMVEHYNYSIDDLENLVLAGLTISWLPRNEQEALLTTFQKEFGQLREELGM